VSALSTRGIACAAVGLGYRVDEVLRQIADFATDVRFEDIPGPVIQAARERMLDVVVEVDGRPLSRFGCDGVVFATPTGSTAYAFSAGGPVVWPEVEAVLMVPICAHALFAGPMVVSPRSVLAAELVSTELTRPDLAGSGLLCGRPTVEGG